MQEPSGSDFCPYEIISETPTTMATTRSKKWYNNIQWFADDDTEEDKKLIIRLDLLIVPYAVLSYWVKYIDQANLSTTTPSSYASTKEAADLAIQIMPTLAG